MQTVILMVTYIATTVAFQCIGFLISRVVDYNYPTLGLMTFLILFLASFGAAWPVAVRIAEWLIVRLGFKLEIGTVWRVASARLDGVLSPGATRRIEVIWSAEDVDRAVRRQGRGGTVDQLAAAGLYFFARRDVRLWH